MKWEIMGDLDSLCCVFFAGFGFNTTVYREFLGQDTLIVSCYDNFENAKDLLCILKQKHFTLIAFSMGVCVAQYLLNPLDKNILHSCAINGTTLGIDKTKGIHPTLFAHTIKHFSQKTFVQNCFNNANIPHCESLLNDTANLIGELKGLQNFCQTTQYENLTQNRLIWERAIIGLQDSIFKPEVQNHAWSVYKELYDVHYSGEKTFEILQIDAPHFIFKDSDACKTIC